MMTFSLLLSVWAFLTYLMLCSMPMMRVPLNDGCVTLAFTGHSTAQGLSLILLAFEGAGDPCWRLEACINGCHVPITSNHAEARL